MPLEHVAIIVQDPPAVARWYTQHLGLRIVRRMEQSPFTHFLADARGMMVEIYNNPAAAVPDYRAVDPLVLHLAFTAGDVTRQRERLLAAGASAAGPIARTPDGDELAMLRDPWGLAIQLVQRAAPMV